MKFALIKFNDRTGNQLKSPTVFVFFCFLVFLFVLFCYIMILFFSIWRQLLNEDIQIDQILAPLEQLRHVLEYIPFLIYVKFSSTPFILWWRVLGEFDRDLSQTKLNKGIPGAPKPN